MKKILSIFLLIIIVFQSAAGERKKVAVVLGGGGAKGVSHIGALKVIEKAGIPIDYVVGTSMGAIVGGLYSIGYTPEKIDSIVKAQDWTMLLSDRIARSSQSFPEKEVSERYILSLPFGKEKKDRTIQGVIKGQNLQNLFSNLTIGYHDAVDFGSFQKSFACVAVDVVDGKEYVFTQGSLPLAMRASMAIPAVFTPVRLDSMVLVDGGLNNNYPADIARRMGAEIIIGIDLGTSDLKKLKQINTPGDVIGQIIALHGNEKYEKNKEMTDLLLRPNMSPYNAASFNSIALDTLINRGEQEARARWNELIALKKKIGISDDFKQEKRAYSKDPTSNCDETFYIRSISFAGIDPRDENWLLKLCKLKENSYTTIAQLKRAMDIIIGTDLYSNVSYKLSGQNQDELILSTEAKAMSSLNLGVRFDTEEIMAILLNATLDYRSRFRSQFAITGRVSESSYARLDYTIENNPLRNFNIAYMLDYKDIDIYQKGEKFYNTTYLHHLAEFGYTDMNWLNFKFQAGIRYEYYDYNRFLYSEGSQEYHLKPEDFINYFALAHFETFDRGYFPNKGVSFRAQYEIHTDNFLKYKGKSPFSSLSACASTVIPLSSHLSLLPFVYGRTLLGDNPAYPYLNVLGGEVFSKYLPQQMPFTGINRMEVTSNSILIGKIQLRQRIGNNHFISLIGNFGMHHDRLENITDGKHIWGGSIGYGFNSVAGPLNASLGISDQTDKVQFYMNLGYYF
ncbi:patatin-like phospholipase family protein [Massilibacteroides sp.]|uniref:patatin-like phospholipase family protein n=1 Tax=Massilibacteroides sp. TaxID=2034766 RepID=UPI00261C41D4|nr:patatin-like phospholipase family protein [Massilibacteroides sp.]MDD4516107.1 patatin-like phospholipase family protein [Massilibacteroides sp.]